MVLNENYYIKEYILNDFIFYKVYDYVKFNF